VFVDPTSTSSTVRTDADAHTAIGRSMETAERQVRVIEGGTTEPWSSAVAAVSSHNNRKPQPQQHRVAETNERRCRNCGGAFPHPGGRTSCLAWGKQCRLCLKDNYFARQCRSATEQQRTTTKLPFDATPDTITTTSTSCAKQYCTASSPSTSRAGQRP